MSRSVDPGLRDCLERLRADGDRRLAAHELADIIGEVAQTLTADMRPLGNAIQAVMPDADQPPASAADPDRALEALADVNGGAAGEGQLAALKEELIEIRAALQVAAATFLSAAEAIENIAAHPDMDADDQAQLYQFATDIYEASGFQDITGQRLTRMAEILSLFELSVVRAQAALGNEAAIQAVDALGDSVHQTENRKMERILHGPQNAGKANTQEEIDKILASFD